MGENVGVENGIGATLSLVNFHACICHWEFVD